MTQVYGQTIVFYCPQKLDRPNTGLDTEIINISILQLIDPNVR